MRIAMLTYIINIPAAEMCDLIDRADATVFVADEVRADVIAAAKESCPKLKYIISMQKEESSPEVLSFWQLVNGQEPFFFAEAGCMQIAGSGSVPNNWALQGPPDQEEQANWYRALLTACQARSWFGGTAFWDWPLPAYAQADRYAFTQGPALDVIRSFYCAGK